MKYHFYLQLKFVSCSYLIWNDSFVATERIADLKPYQRINHFPGMGEICRKDCLARNMAKYVIFSLFIFFSVNVQFYKSVLSNHINSIMIFQGLPSSA